MNKLVPALMLFLIVWSVAHADEAWDLETLPYLRTKQYSAGDYEHIIVYSPPRTGSSLIYNIMRFLFEDEANLSSHHDVFDLDRKVLKTHKKSEIDLTLNNNDLYVYTFRDPIQAGISIFRITNGYQGSMKKIANIIARLYVKHLVYSERLEQEGLSFFRLYYEDFNDNLDDAFGRIENHFGITIDERDKDLIKQGYSKKSVASNIEDMENFKEYLPVSGFHGDHLVQEDYQPPKEFLKWLNIYIEAFKPFYRKYGYFTEDRASI